MNREMYSEKDLIERYKKLVTGKITEENFEEALGIDSYEKMWNYIDSRISGKGNNPYMSEIDVHPIYEGISKNRGSKNITKYTLECLVNCMLNPSFVIKKINKTHELTKEGLEYLIKSKQVPSDFTSTKIYIKHYYGVIYDFKYKMPALVLNAKTRQSENFRTYIIGVNHLYFEAGDYFKDEEGEVLLFPQKYDMIISKFDRILQDHQVVASKFLLKNKKVILADTMGLGKAHLNTTPIYTEDGWKTFSDIKIGDYVFDIDGNKKKVKGVFPQKEKMEVYDIQFSDGSTTNCTLNHIWRISDVSTNQTVDWSLEEIITKYNLKIGEEYSFVDEEGNYKVRIPSVRKIGASTEKPTLDMTDDELESLCDFIIQLSVGKYTLNDTAVNVSKRIGYKYDIYRLFDISLPEVFMTATQKEKQKILNFLKLGIYFNNLKHIGQEGLKSTFFEVASLKLLKQILHLAHSCGETVNVEYLYDGTLNSYSTYLIQFTRDDFKYIKNITKRDGTYDTTCIEVEDDIYVVDTANIVTHNTTSSIVASLEGNFNKVLIVTNASIKTTWVKELKYFGLDEKDINVVSGSDWGNEEKRFNIINYDILKNFYSVPETIVYQSVQKIDENGKINWVQEPVMVKCRSSGKMVPKTRKTRDKKIIQEHLDNSLLFKQNFDCIIIDEVHRLSNSSSKRYKIMEDFLKRNPCNYVFLLTGTPLTNRPMNLFNILKLINSDITKHYRAYAFRYCGGKTIRLKDGREILIAQGATNLDELKERIKNVYIRRVFTDIPGVVNKTKLCKFFDLDDKDRKEYNRLWLEYTNKQQEEGNFDALSYRDLVEGTLMRQFLAKKMTPNTIEMVEDALEESDDKKVVVVCSFQDELDAFIDHFKDKAVKFNGLMNAKKKAEAEYEFQNNPEKRVFVANQSAVAEGLSLTASNLLIFNSFGFSSALALQTEDRVYRLNSKQDVTVIYNVFADTYMEEVYNSVMNKIDIFNKTIVKESDKKKEYSRDGT